MLNLKERLDRFLARRRIKAIDQKNTFLGDITPKLIDDPDHDSMFPIDCKLFGHTYEGSDDDAE